MLRIDRDTFRGYERADFEDAWSRYLPAEQPQQPQQVNNGGTFRGESNRNTAAPVAVGESAKSPAATGVVAGVAVEAEEAAEGVRVGADGWAELP